MLCQGGKWERGKGTPTERPWRKGRHSSGHSAGSGSACSEGNQDPLGWGWGKREAAARGAQLSHSPSKHIVGWRGRKGVGSEYGQNDEGEGSKAVLLAGPVLAQGPLRDSSVQSLPS